MHPSEEFSLRPVTPSLRIVPHLRVVIDTNVWISRLLMSGSTAARAVDRALSVGNVLVSEAAMNELAVVLARPKFDRYITLEDRRDFLRRVGGVVQMVVPTVTVQTCRDPDDDRFLELAVSGAANYLITGDADLLSLHPFYGVAIVSPGAFLDVT